MPLRMSVPALLAYGLSACFIAAGLLTLAGGDAHIAPNRVIRQPTDMVGDERHLFGALLLAAGYVLMRWVFRRANAGRRLGVELQIIALLTMLGYAAYQIGGG